MSDIKPYLKEIEVDRESCSMSNLNENLRIVSVREMMVERLAIPNYQRPYQLGNNQHLD